MAIIEAKVIRIGGSGQTDVEFYTRDSGNNPTSGGCTAGYTPSDSEDDIKADIRTAISSYVNGEYGVSTTAADVRLVP